MTQSFEIHPIGIVTKEDKATRIEIEPRFHDGLRGLEEFSHIVVFYWFDRNDTPERRTTLQVHPRKDETLPLTGVFATHAPVRPNLIAMTVCRLLSVRDGVLYVEEMDALDGSPVIDIKCYIPPETGTDVRLPRWVRHGNQRRG